MKHNATILAALGAILAGHLHANIITVGPAGGGYNHTSLTAALAAARDGDTIRVAAATYSTATGESFPLLIEKALTVEAMIVTDRPHLQGDRLNTVISITVPNVTLRGLWITDGSGSEGIYGMDGGGICIFVNDDASGSVLITDCLIEQNTCPFDETYNGCGGGIYCGGTWCTCFEIGIVNTVIRSNGIPVNNGVFGNGGGVFCGMLSKVWIENCVIEANSANDRGGGVFVDSYGLATLWNSHVRNNISPGDPTRAGWGGKGGGVFLDGEAVCTVTGCDITGNTALYYGGGLFTMSGLTDTSTGGLCTNTGSHFFTMPVLSNVVSGSLVASNIAGLSGGGAYIRDHAYLAFQSTTNYWNNATLDGGGVCVAGGASGGGKVEFANQCLLEGNECAGRGAGVFLGTTSHGAFRDTRFLGNSSGLDGGAAFLDSAATATLANCLVTYNNAARGYGGAFRLQSTASAQLQHCSVVGNFAPWARSGFYLDTNATLAVTNSILWRNAGGSVQTNGGTLRIAFSLDEDGPGPLTGSPGYHGWGTNTDIFVGAAGPCPGTGTSNSPFCSLQVALDRYDFRLAANSPCLGAASDGGNVGANTGVDGAAGNTVAALHLGSGTYDIRGRNIIFTRGLQGAGANNSTIWNAVFGYTEDTFIRDLAITGERWFGGLVLRGDANMDRCRVFSNTALQDGGGIYVCEGMKLRIRESVVDFNRADINGGGLFFAANVVAEVNGCQIASNGSQSEGGGLCAAANPSLFVTNCSIAQNTSWSLGAGLRLGGVVTIHSSFVTDNAATAHGGGIYVSGRLGITNTTIVNNTAAGSLVEGGGTYVANGADVVISHSVVSTNSASSRGGGISCQGDTRIYDCVLENNSTWAGGAINCAKGWSPYCENSTFRRNTADYGGAVCVREYGPYSPSFIQCQFEENSASSGGGAVHSSMFSLATFDRCTFTTNRANYFGGGFDSYFSTTTFTECEFAGNMAGSTGGAANLRNNDSSRFINCSLAGSQAADSGGAVHITETAHPTFLTVLLLNNRAGQNGGAVACAMQSSPHFQDVTISGNVAVLGGGVFADGSASLMFERCELSGNRAESTTVSADGGAACFTSNAVARFACSRIINNEATDDGGGFSAAGQATVGLTNTFIALNHAVNSGGGAHFTSRSAGSFQNCTVVSNAVDISNGGGIYVEANCYLNADSSIIHRNLPDGVAPQHGNAVVNFSCVQEPWPGTGNITSNPLLNPATLFLLDGSPCIDAGNPSPLLTDSSIPPGKGTLRNDMGASGGPRNCCAPPVTPQWFITTVGTWKFWDRGQTPPGNWRETSYNDADWSSGFAKFGAGGDGEVTTINLGTNAEQHFISTYFRRAFFVANAASVASLEARLICDDGAMLYLNGVEASRYNMPAGNVAFGTLASSAVSGADENRWVSLPLSAGLLVEGWNVLAVEVHQAAPDSGDLSFDLQLASTATWVVVPPPRTYYVNDDSTAGDVFTSAIGNDSNAGTVPELPLRHLSTVFARYTLEPGDVICLDTGLYADSATVPSGTRGVTLLGAGMDRSVVDAGQVTNCLVLDHVLGMTIRDLTLRRGKAARLLYGTVRGGALLCTWSDLYMTNVALRDSTADYGGGAWVDRSDVVLNNVVFSGNLATNQGGGLFLDYTRGDGSRHVVTNCVISGNQAYQQGGGLFVLDGLVQACTINDNSASDHGGGAFLILRSRIEGCSLTANQSKYAGGVYLADWVTMRDCTITSNTASLDGGGLRTWSSTPLSNCVFVGNICTNSGGGANLWGSASARNCTFVANHANWAGGLTVDGNVVALDCVITNNIANYDSGGLRVYGFASASNCLVAGNAAPYGGGVSVFGSGTVRDSVITNNAATTESGGLRGWDSALVSNCLVAGNGALSAGGLSLHHNARGQACIITNNAADDAGGLRLYDSAGISNCSLSGNLATNWGGGAVAHHSSSLENCRIWSNHATWGGGLDLVDTAVARNCVISNNTANTDGGGAYLWNSAILSNCTITANSAVNNSGGGVLCNGKVLVQNCLVLDNAAPGWSGGGVCILNGGSVRNSLMRGNIGNYGGGLYLSTGTAENCTIAVNSAGKGGGLYIDSGAVSNTIIYFNQSINGSNYHNNSLNYSYSHCCTAPSVPNVIGSIVANPRFLDQASGDFRLATNSPCLDAGINCSWMINAFDLDGKPRILNGIVDLGAYEAISPTPVSGMRLGLRSPQPLGSNGFDFILNSLPGLYCRVEASTDLVHWTTITNLISTDATTYFQDPAAANYRQRFYRTVVP